MPVIEGRSAAARAVEAAMLRSDIAAACAPFFEQKAAPGTMAALAAAVAEVLRDTLPVGVRVECVVSEVDPSAVTIRFL